MIETDFLIIGGGIAGAGLAYFLAGHGSTMIIEMEDQPGYHTTGRSAAFLAETYGGPKIQPLTTGSKPFFTAPPEGFIEAPLLTALGAVHIFTEEQRERAEKMAAELQQALPGVKLLTKSEVVARAPYLSHYDFVGGIDDPDCGSLDVAALHQGYLRGAKHVGATIMVNAGLEGAVFENGRWRVKIRHGEVFAKTLINASGAWADEVAVRAGVKPIGMQPLQRTIVTVENPEGLPFDPTSSMIIDADERFYFKPEGTGYILSPADEKPVQPSDAQPDIEDVALAVHYFEEATGVRVKSIEAKWAGLRTFAPDRAPVIGYDANTPGFFWNVGQGGYGIQTSPAWSRVAASLVLNKGMPDDLVQLGCNAENYSPARFS
ncbi:FAD-binding oxidoreductase [Kordiimonas sp. SCSIO 12610]|uniref:NAD(P)/FAD-dependent oxidoreductase n=1 Tax=Kordiimonas sp. SCSIO 12610 TaxID=2829597 RepID=UPI00210B374F|nr:FAD-dependent oxidoreductase [Kordiimonas sp. SCSIO 12610]UTW56016.1 FAD-binding oxidoreductase [Kordiimonas sp. SCSIO 12610]